MVGGTLYTSNSLSQVAAIDAATGETKWCCDPKVYENGLAFPPMTAAAPRRRVTGARR